MTDRCVHASSGNCEGICDCACLWYQPSNVCKWCLDRARQAMLDIERVSHVLGRTLRYHAEHLGLHPDRDGFVVVAELLHMPELENLTVTDIQRVVATSVGSRGMRFEIRDHGGDIGMEIRALYKHDSPGRSVLESGGFSRGDSLSRGNTRRSGLHRDDSARTSRTIFLSFPLLSSPLSSILSHISPSVSLLPSLFPPLPPFLPPLSLSLFPSSPFTSFHCSSALFILPLLSLPLAFAVAFF